MQFDSVPVVRSNTDNKHGIVASHHVLCLLGVMSIASINIRIFKSFITLDLIWGLKPVAIQNPQRYNQEVKDL